MTHRMLKQFEISGDNPMIILPLTTYMWSTKSLGWQQPAATSPPNHLFGFMMATLDFKVWIAFLGKSDCTHEKELI